VIARLLRRRWPALAGAGLATVVMTAGELAAPWPLKFVIDRVLDGHSGVSLRAADWRFLALIASAAVAIAVVQALAGYAAALWLKRAGEALVHDLRVATYTHLQRLSVPFHDTRQKGDLVQRITADVNAVGQIFAESLGAVTAALLLLVGMGAVTVWLDPVLAFVLFATVPPLALVTFRYRRRVQLLARRQRKAEGEIASIATEALGAIRLVKAFGSERHESDRVEVKSETRRAIGVDVSRAEARFAGLVDVLGAVAIAAILIAGAQRVSTGALTTGGLVVFAAYAQKVYRPLRDLARQAAAISRGMARAERVAEILAADAVMADATDGHRGARARGDLLLENVTFAYPGERTALDGVTLTIPNGQCVAVVGASGAGKSTLAALVARFHDPQDGRILIDDHDLRSCSMPWLRDQICLLLQDTVLFSGTVADNIAYATHAGRERVEEAARAAGADAFISALPDGYDTVLGPSGVGLSGGQRQRIGIARVLLRDPAVLLLDEPTTGLDAATAARLADGLLGLAAGRTTVLITHSLDLARRADRVVILEGGRIVADGPPQVLEGGNGTAAQPAGTAAAAHGGGRLSRPRPQPPADPRLPALAGLLAPDALHSLLARVSPDVHIRAITVRTVDYEPFRRATITAEATTSGARYGVVVRLDRHADLRTEATSRRAADLTRLAAGRTPGANPVVLDPGTGALVTWLPVDLRLPLLAEPAHALAARAGATTTDSTVEVASYRAGVRVTCLVGDRVVKQYAAASDHAAARRGLHVAAGAGVGAPRLIRDLADDRAIVIERLADGEMIARHRWRTPPAGWSRSSTRCRRTTSSPAARSCCSPARRSSCGAPPSWHPTAGTAALSCWRAWSWSGPRPTSSSRVTVTWSRASSARRRPGWR
jgi:ATP-binding cassette, subfamily B, bacterial